MDRLDEMVDFHFGLFLRATAAKVVGWNKLHVVVEWTILLLFLYPVLLVVAVVRYVDHIPCTYLY